MCRLIIFFCVFLSSSAAICEELVKVTPEEAGYDSQKLNTLTQIADELYNDGRIPNYVIALYKNKENFFTASRGRTRVEVEEDSRLDESLRVVQRSEEVSRSTLYHMMSMTKPIVTTAFLKLVNDEGISLSEPLSKHFPEFEQMLVAPNGDYSFQFEPAKRQITLADLVSHTSGFSYPDFVTGFADVGRSYRELNIFFDRDMSTLEHMTLLAQIPLVAHPGEEFNYGVSVDVLGALIEQISGTTLDQYLKLNLFEPLGMNSTGFVIDSSDFNRMSDIYGARDWPLAGGSEFKPIGMLGGSSIDWKISNLIPAAFYMNEPRFYQGGGGLISTADDYAKYLTMIATGGMLDGRPVVDKEIIDTHFTEYVSGIEQMRRAFGEAARYMKFGAGFGIKNEPDDLNEVDYYFWAGAFNTFFWIDPKDNSVGLFLTSHWPVVYNISDRLEEIVDQARLGG